MKLDISDSKLIRLKQGFAITLKFAKLGKGREVTLNKARINKIERAMLVGTRTTMELSKNVSVETLNAMLAKLLTPRLGASENIEKIDPKVLQTLDKFG